MRWLNPAYLFGLLLLTATATFFAFHTLGERPLWGDEQRTLSTYARHPFDLTNGDPPLYSLVLQHVHHYTNSRFWLRCPNALALIAAALVLAFGCRNWFGRGVALAAAFAFASSFLVLSCGQWLRPYAFVTLFSVLAYVSFWKMLTTTHVAWLVVNVLSILLAVHTQYNAVTIPVAQCLFGLVYAMTLTHKKSKTLIVVLLATGAILLGALPWYYQLLTHFATFVRMNGVQPPADFNLALFVYHIIVKAFPRANPGVIQMHTIVVLLVLAAGIAISFWKKKYLPVLLTLSWIAGPAGFLWVCLELGRISMAQRYYMAFVPALYLLLFHGIFSSAALLADNVSGKYRTATNCMVGSVLTVYVFLPALLQIAEF